MRGWLSLAIPLLLAVVSFHLLDRRKGKNQPSSKRNVEAENPLRKRLV